MRQFADARQKPFSTSISRLGQSFSSHLLMATSMLQLTWQRLIRGHLLSHGIDCPAFRRDLALEILLEDPNHRLLLSHLEDLVKCRTERKLGREPKFDSTLSFLSSLIAPLNINGDEPPMPDHSSDKTLMVLLPSLPEPVPLHTFSHTLATLHPLTAKEWTSQAIVACLHPPNPSPYPGSIAAAAAQVHSPSNGLSGLRVSSSSPQLRNGSQGQAHCLCQPQVQVQV